MNISLFLTLAFAHLVAVISPGPDFFYIVKSSFQRGLANSIVSSIGIGLGVFFQCIFAIIGLDFLYKQIPSLYTVIGTTGAVYLIYIGLSGLLNKMNGSKEHQDGKIPLEFWKSFSGGLLVNLLNVKAFIFFVSLFSGIIISTSFDFQLTISVYFFLATAAWFCFLSYSLHIGKSNFLNVATQQLIAKMSSALLIVIGILLGLYVWCS
tara:strand:- start:1943 stop:2566 length:624 start_codon:yes stop_codon:yes gene_type:complete